jgi:hypothetical protein
MLHESYFRKAACIIVLFAATGLGPNKRLAVKSFNQV